jgi:putative ABC transport system permease protein
MAHETRGRRWIDHLLHDVRSGVRQLRRNPRFTAAALVTLALGIGGATAIFTVANGVLFRQLPYRDPDRLVQFWTSFRQHRMERVVFSHVEFLDYRARIRGIDDVGAYSLSSQTLTQNGDPEQVYVSGVSANLFDLLGAAPLHGRTFREDENRGANVVVLGHALWQRSFGGRAGIVGQAIVLEGVPHEVVGIMPATFRSPATTADLWRPLVFAGDAVNERQRGSRSLWMIGRLKGGTSLDGARREMAFHAQQIAAAHRDQYPEALGYEVTAVRLHDQVTGGVRRAVLVMLGAVGALLLIACANVANLLLARSTERQVEVAVRSALGASRGRIVSQFLIESVVLAMIGGAAGTLLAVWSVEFLLQWIPAGVLPRAEEVVFRSSVFWFSLALSLTTGLVFGLAPAFQVASSSVAASLRDASRTSIGRRSNALRGMLMVAEVALALVLLAGAGLLIRSFIRVISVPSGFDAGTTLTMRIVLPAAKYVTRGQQIGYFDQLAEHLRTLGGVQSVGLVSSLPFSGWRNDWTVTVDGGPAQTFPPANYFAVNADYFESLRIPLQRGREFLPSDASDMPVVIVNRTLAERFWPEQDPIGKRLKMGGPDSPWPWRTVIGVVGDVRQTNLETPVMPEIFVLHEDERKPVAPGMFLVVRAAADPAALVGAIRREVTTLDPDQAITSVRQMSERVSLSLAERKLHVLLLGIFAAVALALAAVGVYGVIACSMTQRTREIGLRLALGAQKGDVFRLVVGRGMWLASAGVLLGLAGAVAIGRVLESLLFEVQPTDPVTFIAVALLLTAVALLACAVPARRASNLDPMDALRHT